jgi:hypothetical protein
MFRQRDETQARTVDKLLAALDVRQLFNPIAGFAMTNSSAKLPQARMYLQAAQWGFDELLAKRHLGNAFVFHLVGIFASLRAVQHSLKSHDRTLSEEHKRVIDEWWNATPLTFPELHFIVTSRNLLLKAGSFPGYAIVSESSTGEEPHVVIISTNYELVYYGENRDRQDLEEAIRKAIRWCDRELTALEAKLPPLN